MQVVLLPCLVSCDGFKPGSRGFLVRSWAMRWARSSLKLVIGSIGFWQDPIDSLSYPVLLWVFTLCLNSCNTLLPNLDWFGSALSRSVIFTSHVRILLQKACGSRVLPNSRNRTNLGCYVLRVQACQSCVNLDRTGYHAVDAGFWGCFRANHPVD
jgi:hypothetical protein